MKTSPFVIIALLATTPAFAGAGTDAMAKKARAAVRSVLKDPASAQFRGDIFTRSAVCGQVNSKNSFGGYTGNKIYAYVIATGEVLIMDGPASAEKANNWTRVDALCGM